MEDGFLRSVGLGAGFSPALSYVFDESGICSDPAHPSDIETLLSEAEFDAALIERAARLIALIRTSGVTKYNLAPRVPLSEPPAGREVILVPGQVGRRQIRSGAGRRTCSQGPRLPQAAPIWSCCSACGRATGTPS